MFDGIMSTAILHQRGTGRLEQALTCLIYCLEMGSDVKLALNCELQFDLPISRLLRSPLLLGGRSGFVLR